MSTLVTFSLILPTEAELLIRPEAFARAYYDDNVRLQENPADGVFATINDIRAEASYIRPSYEISLTPRFRLSRYSKETELGSEDYFVTLNGSKTSERSRYFSEFRYQREGSFITEQTDSDRFNVNVPRTTLALELSWQHAINDRTTISVFGNALDVSFEDPPALTLIDYQQYGTGASLNTAISDKTSLVAIVSVSRFKTPQISSKTLSYSYQFGFEHQFDETMNASFLIGNNKAQSDFKSTETRLISLVPLRFTTEIEDASSNTSGEIINLSAEKKFARGFVRLEWDRSFSPSSEGSRRRDQRVNGHVRYRFGNRLVGDLDANYRESRQEQQESTLGRLNEREVLRARSQLRYEFARHWWAEAGFLYSQVRRLGPDTTSASHRVFLALHFEPQEFMF